MAESIRDNPQRLRLDLQSLVAWGTVTIAAIALVWFARIANLVVLPLVLAAWLALLLWPLHRWAARKVSPWIASALATGVAVLAILFTISWGWYAIDAAVEEFQSSRPQYVERYQNVTDWLARRGVPESWMPELRSESGDGNAPASSDDHSKPSSGNGLTNILEQVSPQTRERLAMLVTGGIGSTMELVGGLILTLFLLYLALPAVGHWRDALDDRTSARGKRFTRQCAEDIGLQLRSYTRGRTMSGLVAGTATGLWFWVMGVPLPHVWAVLSFLFNYIPNIGVFISAAPPCLLAVVKLGFVEGLAVIAGKIVIELITGNLLDPLIQSGMLKLSAFTILASVLFWGWLLGIVGAALAPTLTAAIVLVFSRLDFRDDGKPDPAPS